MEYHLSGIPKNNYIVTEGLKALSERELTAEKTGVSDISLDDINDKITFNSK